MKLKVSKRSCRDYRDTGTQWTSDPTKYNADRLKARRLVNDRMQEVRAEQAQQQKDAEREALKAAMRKEVIAELEAEAKAKAETPKKK